MPIDLIYLLLLLVAIIKGWKKGLINAVFSFVSLFIGLLAALKLSSAVAVYLSKEFSISYQWLPAVSFTLVLVATIFILRLAGSAIDKIASAIMLGTLTKLGGIVFYAAIYTICYSIVLFYISKMQLFPAQTFDAAICYPYIKSIGPAIIDGLARIAPYFKDMFSQLSQFFDKTIRP